MVNKGQIISQTTMRTYESKLKQQLDRNSTKFKEGVDYK